MSRAPQAPPFSRSLAYSVVAHAGLAALLLFQPRLHFDAPAPPLEIEIISPFLGTGPAKLGAPKPFVPGPPAKVNVTAPEPPKPVEKTPEPPKDWVLPGPETKTVEEAAAPQTTPGGAPGGAGTAAKPGGSGEGSDEGEINGTGDGGTALSAFPKLLNRDEVLANLRRFYPPVERSAGREGDVVLMLHISKDGAVGAVEVARSGGASFDGAALKSGLLMKFSPAIDRAGKPAAVRWPKLIQFRLGD